MTLRQLPSVDRLAASIGDDLPAVLAIEVARHALAEARRRMEVGDPVDVAALATREAGRLRRTRPGRVINATGVLLHTNLGRAPIGTGPAAMEAEASSGYGNVEFDLSTGERGGRGGYVTTLLQALTGAEDGLVVNNNAGALYLALAALASGGRVVVARGELIEIGGSFRLPDLMTASGATLHEVGTTNRTRVADYAAAVDGASLLLKVHPSNYRIEGFSEEASYGELADLGAAQGVALVADVGSGLLDDRCPWLDGPPPAWLRSEPGVRQVLDAGADVVLFSGDKLLGGPQAGIAVGGRESIERMRRHPVARALRAGGPTLAALAATLEAYGAGRGGDIPFWNMATTPYETLAARAGAVIAAAEIDAQLIEDASTPGAGSAPGEGIPSPVIRVGGASDRWFRALLMAPVPVVARRAQGGLILDLRAVVPEDDARVISALRAAAAAAGN